jgi:hypothetical protein
VHNSIFSKEVRTPYLECSKVIWKGVKGLDSIMPAPKRAAFVELNSKDED